MKLNHVFFLSAMAVFAANLSFASEGKTESNQLVAEASEVAETSLRTANISVNPLGFLFGLGNVDTDFGISDNLAIGPSFQYSPNFLTTGIAVYGAGAHLTIFLGHERFTSGWFVRPQTSFTYGSSSSTTYASAITAGADAGYWWFWKNGFNLGLGAGGQYMRLDGSNLSEFSTNSPNRFAFSGIAQFGWSF